MSLSKPPSRRYNKSFLSAEFRDRHADHWDQWFSADWKEFRAGAINGAELCSRLLLMVYKDLFGSRWRNGMRASADTQFFEKAEFKALHQFARWRVRSFPEAAAQALLRWGRGEIKLQVFQNIPTPQEVLNLQAQGIRCVSVMRGGHQFKSFNHEGRDFCSFLIHDLIHAQLMTEKLEDFEHQIKFALWLKLEWNCLDQGLNIQALRELEYMASDMNSHIVHLIKTFKSWIERHRPDLISRKDWLRGFEAASIENQFSEYWSKINRSGLSNEEIQLLHQNILNLWKDLPNPNASNIRSC